VQHILNKLSTHPWIIGILAITFAFSMAGFWLRIRRDERRKRESRPHGDQTPEKMT
jgi:hypothetical protein